MKSVTITFSLLRYESIFKASNIRPRGGNKPIVAASLVFSSFVQRSYLSFRGSGCCPVAFDWASQIRSPWGNHPPPDSTSFFQEAAKATSNFCWSQAQCIIKSCYVASFTRAKSDVNRMVPAKGLFLFFVCHCTAAPDGVLTCSHSLVLLALLALLTLLALWRRVCKLSGACSSPQTTACQWPHAHRSAAGAQAATPNSALDCLKRQGSNSTGSQHRGQHSNTQHHLYHSHVKLAAPTSSAKSCSCKSRKNLGRCRSSL